MENSERIKEKVFSNGDIYVGNFRGMIPHGKGKYTWSDGTAYEGDWEEGKMTGKGRIGWSSGATYEGDFSGGYIHGFGTYTRSDGSIYIGSWRMNIQHGLGKKQYSNLDIYEGSWKEGLHEGRGRYAWTTGNTYIGNWKAGKMFGRGVMKWANGDLFDGCWLDGYRHGTGFYRFADGGYYFGTWTGGLKDGKGTFYPAGTRHNSLPKWGSPVRYDDKTRDFSRSSSLYLDESTVSKPSPKHSLSENFSIGGLLRSSSRKSNRTSSLNEDWRHYGSDISGIISHTCDEEEQEVKDSSALAYEREYMQGVLIREKVVNMPHKRRQRNTFHATEVKNSSCLDIFGSHQNYYLKLNLQLGIRYTVGKITPVPMREVRSSDFGDRARIRMYFPRKGSQLTPPHYSIDFFWKDYCPMVFRNLRELFKLDAAEYMMSICGDDGLRELPSPGKSGSIFYVSRDDRFVIKTLRRSEVKALLRMLPKYYKHVKENENTLITKFFGLHRITLKGGKKVRFIVMGNMFCTELRIHRRYDLKGSRQGRYTANLSTVKDTTTLKDLDLTYQFHMDKLLRKTLIKQITQDCKFLESQQIIDYSLLLGLHFRAPEHLRTLDNCETFPSGDAPQGPSLVPPNGLHLVTHEPRFASALRGSHIRGSTLRALSVGDQEADLLVPGTGRLPVHLGVNMPAQANHKLLQNDGESSEVELFEVYDVVLYLGIIDILQEYNMKKKMEHGYKSLIFDPLSISVVAPRLYSKRFIGFLKKIFPDQP